jgi:hypothetical protein
MSWRGAGGGWFWATAGDDNIGAAINKIIEILKRLSISKPLLLRKAKSAKPYVRGLDQVKLT